MKPTLPSSSNSSSSSPSSGAGLGAGVLSYFSLFSSFSTLICCALPALLVSLGMGAVVAGTVSQFPSLIWLSENKDGVFVFAGSLLALNGFLLWKGRNAPCPIDPQLRMACIRGRKWSRIVYFFSLGLFAVGIFFGFLAVEIFA